MSIEPSAPQPSWMAKASQTGKSVLLVEDNEGVRRATSALLKAMGYRAIEASNGSEALAIVQALFRFNVAGPADPLLRRGSGVA